MHKRGYGQEAVEFVLISIVVFFASLFVLMVFGEQIAAFFNNNPTGTDKEIAVYSETDGTQTDVGPRTVPIGTGTEVTLPLGNGTSIDITIPDTEDYIQTAGSDGDTLSTLADLVDIYGDLISDIASEEGANANLARLAEVMKSVGDLQSQLYPTYQVDEENQKQWLTDLDPTNPDSMSVVNNFLNSLEVTFDQMQNEASTDASFTNTFIGTDNPVTNPATYDQMAYAKELLAAFQAVSSDASISDEVKETVELMVDQVKTISNNTSYVIDENLYNDSLTELSAIKTAVDLKATAYTPLTVSDSVPVVTDSVDLKVSYIKDLYTMIDSDPELMASLSVDQKETLIDIAKTINIQINQPPETVLNMDLAEQISCIANPASCSTP